jgi:hypothetical protein
VKNRGNQITIVFEGKAHRAVIAQRCTYVFYWKSDATEFAQYERHDKLGITWERGWNTPEARALMTSVALSC